MTFLVCTLIAIVYVFGAMAAWALYNIDCPPSHLSWGDFLMGLLMATLWPLLLIGALLFFAIWAIFGGNGGK